MVKWWEFFIKMTQKYELSSYELSPSLQKTPEVLSSVDNLCGDGEFPNAISVFAKYAEFNDGLKFKEGTPEDGKNFAVDLSYPKLERAAEWEYVRTLNHEEGAYEYPYNKWTIKFLLLDG